VYYYLFIYSFIQFPLFIVEQVCRSSISAVVHKWICALKNGTPLCSSMSAPVCSCTQGVWIFLSYTDKILTKKNLEHAAFWHWFWWVCCYGCNTVGTRVLYWNTVGFWMMLLIVSCSHYYFAILREVFGVGLHLQALIQNTFLIAEVGEVTSCFSFPSKSIFLPVLMLRSYCGQAVTV